MAQRVVVVDYGMGNLRSVAKALEHVVEAGDRVSVTSQPDEILDADRGVTFTSALSRYNQFAVQFHPEKSADAGLILLRNFVRWEPTVCC